MLNIIPTDLNRTTINARCYVFYGAAGAGMMPLIQWLLDGGAEVYALDDRHYYYSDKRLKVLSSLRQVPAYCTAAIYTTGLPPQHKFFEWARNNPSLEMCCSRPRFLQIVSQQRSLIAITGTHGKTNTTAALSWLLQRQGMKCDYLIGGERCDNQRYGAQDPLSQWIIIEADESQTTLQYYQPEIGIVLNSFGDHLEFFDHTHQNYHDNIAQFIGQSQHAIIDAATAKQHQWAPKNASFFDTKGAHLPSGELIHYQPVTHPHYPLITQTPHAWQFQMAGLALCQALALPLPEPEVWMHYPGVACRLEPLDQKGQCWRDYGHHPTELLSVYDALRRRYPDKELVLIFQPHKYSRTAREFQRFINVLRLYDKIYLLPTEPSGEMFDRRWESDCLLQQLNPVVAQYWPTWQQLEGFVQQSHEMVLFQGAGRIMRYARSWAQKRQECLL